MKHNGYIDGWPLCLGAVQLCVNLQITHNQLGHVQNKSHNIITHVIITCAPGMHKLNDIYMGK